MRKVEPPNWWIGLPPNPMLLLTGEGLSGATVSTTYSGVRVVRSETSANGHYLFIWLDIPPTTKAGTASLTVRTSAGTTAVNFALGQRTYTPQGLSSSDVIYLIMPDRFADGDTANDEPAPQLHTFDRNSPRAWHGGDLRGIREHLPYLHDLGVTAIWMTPFCQNDWTTDDHSYHGYHVTDFYSVDGHLGTLRDLTALVSDAHRLGIKVVLDFVANHTGPANSWVEDPPRAQWFHGTPAHHVQPIYNFNELVDPHAVARLNRGVLEGWFVDKLPDVNPDDPYLAQYLLENAEWWAESAGLDAFRLDTFPYSSRRFWSGWHEGLLRAFPQTFTIGEVSDGDPTITSFFAGGVARWDGIDTHLSTVFDFPLMYALRDVVLRGQPMQRLVDVLQRDWLYPHPERLVTFIGNHDNPRFMGEQGASAQKLKAAFSLLLTLRGLPQLYSGDEIAMPGGGDPDNRRDFPGGFPGNQQNAFTPAGRDAVQQDVFRHVQSLLSLRREHPALQTGRQYHLLWDEGSYAFLRDSPGDRLLVVFNNGNSSHRTSVPLNDSPAAQTSSVTPLFPADAHAALQNGSAVVDVSAESVAILQLK